MILLCFLQNAVVVADIRKNIASSMAEACNCSFTEEHFVKESIVLHCRDSISAEIGMNIKAVGKTSREELVCQFVAYLAQHRNVIDLG